VYTGGTDDDDPSGATLLEDLGVMALTSTFQVWTISSTANPTVPSGVRVWLAFKSPANVTYDTGGTPQDLVSGGRLLDDAQLEADTTTVFPSTLPSVSTTNSTFVRHAWLTYEEASGTATKLLFGTQPIDGVVGQTMAAFTVRATTDADVTVSSFTGDIELIDPPIDFVGTKTVAAVAGVATFGDIVPQKLDEGVTLTAASDGLTSAESNPINVTAPTVGDGNTILAGGSMYYDSVAADSTGVSVELEAVSLVDGSPVTNLTHETAGLVVEGWRGANGTVTEITLAAQTSTGAWTSGGFCHKGNGKYRLDVPNTFPATGVPRVRFEGRGVADVRIIGAVLDLTGSNPRAATSSPADIVAAQTAETKRIIGTIEQTNTTLEVDGESYTRTANTGVQPLGTLTPAV
jgi:hypothetical protein